MIDLAGIREALEGLGFRVKSFYNDTIRITQHEDIDKFSYVSKTIVLKFSDIGKFYNLYEDNGNSMNFKKEMLDDTFTTYMFSWKKTTIDKFDKLYKNVYITSTEGDVYDCEMHGYPY